MTNEELAVFIRDWFLYGNCHYTGHSEYKADVDGTFEFMELAVAIIDKQKEPEPKS